MLNRRLLIKSGVALGLLANTDAVLGATSSAPKIFNTASSASAGDIIYIQGANFGLSPRVMLNGSIEVPIVGVVSDVWLACLLPAEASGAPTLTVVNGDLSSQPIQLNRCEPWHLDCLTLAPSGAFKIFGRNLQLPGYTPAVSVDGLACAVSAVDEHQLNCVAPPGIKSSSAAKIIVSNGLTSATIDRTIAVDTTGSGDALGLGVGWAACFSPILANVINESTLTLGTGSDQTAAFQVLLTSISKAGGGVLQLRTGTYRLDNLVNFPSNVIVRGTGKNGTILRCSGLDHGFTSFVFQCDRVGLCDLTITQPVNDRPQLQIKESTRVFCQRVKFDGSLARVAAQESLDCTNIVFQDCDWVQTTQTTGSQTDPHRSTNVAGFVMTGCTATFVVGAMVFFNVHDTYVARNTFTINSMAADSLKVTALAHGIVSSYSHRIAYRNNVVDCNTQQIGLTTNNDRELFLSESGIGKHARGNVTSATATTLSDNTTDFTTIVDLPSALAENVNVFIVAGKGVGQRRRVISRTTTQLTVADWDVIPDTSSKYSIERTTEKTLILGNTFGPHGNRGCWIYQTSAVDVVIKGNAVVDIYLRQWQSNTENFYCPQWNMLIEGNTISATAGAATAVINSLYVQGGGTPLGVACLGLIVRRNGVTAGVPNFLPSTTNDGMDKFGEGYVLQVVYESSGTYGAPTVPPVLGPIMQDNKATNTDHWLHIGTGIGSAILRIGTLTNSGLASVSTGGGGSAPNYITLPSPPKAPIDMTIT